MGNITMPRLAVTSGNFGGRVAGFFIFPISSSSFFPRPMRAVNRAKPRDGTLTPGRRSGPSIGAVSNCGLKSFRTRHRLIWA